MVREVSDFEVPVMGINLGRMGYLTEVEPKLAKLRMQEFFEGKHAIEERMRIEILIEGAENPQRALGSVEKIAQWLGSLEINETSSHRMRPMDSLLLPQLARQRTPYQQEVQFAAALLLTPVAPPLLIEQ